MKLYETNNTSKFYEVLHIVERMLTDTILKITICNFVCFLFENTFFLAESLAVVGVVATFLWLGWQKYTSSNNRAAVGSSHQTLETA